MSSLAVADGELVLPEPVGKQIDWLNSSASRKVMRIGRRGAKTRFDLMAATLGHGPGWDEDVPLFPGILHGKDVVWIAQNYTNLSTVLWREEIVPRMGHLPWITLKADTHDVSIHGLGSLLLRSGDREAIHSVRGVGARLGGVIVDEAAHLDLRGALQDVILPALLDNGGWLILTSTTNAGKDGGYDDTGAPQIPSYFNVICQEIRAGKRSTEWQEFTGTAYDNPTLDPAAINELIAEYPEGSPKLRQEVFAELLVSGVGLALPTLNEAVHIVPQYRVPSHWTQWGAFDWGFNHPWVFGWFAADEDGNVVVVDTIWGREQLPDVIAQTIISAGVPITHPRFVIHAGHDIWQKKGEAVGYQGPTIAERLQAKKFKLIKANTSRVLGLNNVRNYLQYDEQRPPRLTFMDTPGNRRCVQQLCSMQIDPDNMEDALKVDADPSGRGGDDGYDETRYGLMARPVAARAPMSEPGENTSLGYDYEKQRPRVRLSADEEMEKLLSIGRPHVTANRFRVPQRRR